MIPTTQPELLSLNAAAVACNVTLDYLRKRLASNPALQKLVPRVGRVFVVPASVLPAVREVLAQRAAPTPTASPLTGG